MARVRLDLEDVLIFVFATVILSLSLGTLWDHTLQHPFPTGYLASDAFQHQTRAESIKTMGVYQNEAPWIAAGYTDTVGFYPPGYYYLAIALSYASGLQVFDTIYIIGFLWGLLGALMSYYAIRRYNKHVAILSLPLSLLIFTGMSIIAFTWGATPAMIAQTFMILCVWLLWHISKRGAWLALAFGLCGITFSHGSETIFIGGFLALYLAYLLILRFVLKKGTNEPIINLIAGGVLFTVIASYVLAIVQLIFSHAYPFTFTVLTTHPGFPDFVRIENFGIFALLIGAGLIAACVISWQKRESIPIPLLIGAYMLLIGYGNYFGLDYRAFQARYYWPIYLGVFSGLAIYLLIRLAMKNVRTTHTIAASAAVLILMTGIIPLPLLPHIEPIKSVGIMDQQHWDTLTWLRENTEPDDTVFFFYGETYQPNAVLRNIERVHYLILLDELKEPLELDRNVQAAKLGDCCGTGYPYWKGFLNPGFYWDENGGRAGFYTHYDVCTLDYYVFDKVGRPEFLQYNALYANAMGASGAMQLAFQNDYSIILHNTKPGENCLGNATTQG